MPSKPNIYSGDSARVTIKGYVPSPQAISYGADVKGIYFDGYPQIVKQEGSQPVYKVKKEKDITVTMRDGVHTVVDVYRPDVEGEIPSDTCLGRLGKGCTGGGSLEL